MSSLNNGVGNIKGTPAIITDILANRPSATNLAVGTIFIDSATGNWYQVGTNNTWSSTGGGGGGSATLQQVLDNGNSAENQNLTISNPDNNSTIVIDQDNNYWILVSGDSENTQTQITPNSITLFSNGDETTLNLTSNGCMIKPLNDQYPRSYFYNDVIFTENLYNRIALQNNYDGINQQQALTFIDNIDTNNVSYIVKRPLTDSYDFGIKTFTLPFNNRGTLTLATQEICPAPTGVNINLTNNDFTPNVTNKGALYWIVIAGSNSNAIELNDTFTDYVKYTFLNQVNNTTFKTNTAGVIYGTHTSLAAGIITVIKSGNDFYIIH
jgi:hypothetical protein